MEIIYEINDDLKNGDNRLEFNINLLRSGIKIFTSDTDKIKIVCDDLRKNTFEDIFDISLENSVLQIVEKAKEKSGFGFNLNFKASDYTIEIHLPKDIKTMGKINLSNGSIKADELNFNGSLKQTNGTCKLSKLYSQDFLFTNVNGCLTIDEFIGSAKKINFVNGSVSIKSGKIEGLVIGGVNGTIDIKADFDLKKEAKVATVSGDITVNFDSYSGEKIIKIKTVSGNINLNGDYPQDKIIKASKMNMQSMDALKSIVPMVGNIFKAIKTGKFSKEIKFDIKTDVEKDKSKEENIEKILNMLSDGKITYEQSQNLINAL